MLPVDHGRKGLRRFTADLKKHRYQRRMPRFTTSLLFGNSACPPSSLLALASAPTVFRQLPLNISLKGDFDCLSFWTSIPLINPSHLWK